MFLLLYNSAMSSLNFFFLFWYSTILNCLLVCMGFYVTVEKFQIISRRHHCRWRAANIDLCSALMTIEQWGFFSVPHLLWHGASVYNGHLRGPVTLIPIAESLAVELSLSLFTTQGCRGWDPGRATFRMRGERSNLLRHFDGTILVWFKQMVALFSFRRCALLWAMRKFLPGRSKREIVNYYKRLNTSFD